MIDPDIRYSGDVVTVIAVTGDTASEALRSFCALVMEHIGSDRKLRVKPWFRAEMDFETEGYLYRMGARWHLDGEAKQ